MSPLGVMFATLLPLCSVNQRLPSGPVVMDSGRLATFVVGYCVKTPVVVTLPIAPPLRALPSVTHRLPSRPAAMPPEALSPAGSRYSVAAPDGGILPIRLTWYSVNQRLPSGT